MMIATLLLHRFRAAAGFRLAHSQYYITNANYWHHIMLSLEASRIFKFHYVIIIHRILENKNARLQKIWAMIEK
jgi:hypothetical protein